MIITNISRSICLTAIVTCLSLGALPSAEAQPQFPSAGVEFTYGSISNAVPIVLGGGDDATLIGINLHGHYQIGHGLLVGGHLPLSHVRFNDDSATSLGNLTAELNYRITQRPRSSSWLDTSLSIGTSDNNGDGRLAAISFALFAMEDPGKYAPDTNTLRLMYRHYHSHGALQFEAQAGVQYLSIKDTDNRMRVPLILGLRAAINSRLDGVGRFSTFWDLNAEDDEDSFLHMIEAGVTLSQVGSGSLQALIYYPLDEVYRDTLEVWGVKVGFTKGI